MILAVGGQSPGTQFLPARKSNFLGEVSIDRCYPVPKVSRLSQRELFFNIKSGPFTLGNAKAEVVKQI